MANILANVLLITLIAALLSFAGLYLLRSQWKANVVGRSVLYSYASFAGLLLYIFVYPFIEEITFGFAPYLNILILIGLNIAAWRITYVLIKIQNKEKADDAN